MSSRSFFGLSQIKPHVFPSLFVVWDHRGHILKPLRVHLRVLVRLSTESRVFMSWALVISNTVCTSYWPSRALFCTCFILWIPSIWIKYHLPLPTFEMTHLLNQAMLFANALLYLFERIISGPSPNQPKYNFWIYLTSAAFKKPDSSLTSYIFTRFLDTSVKYVTWVLFGLAVNSQQQAALWHFNVLDPSSCVLRGFDFSCSLFVSFSAPCLLPQYPKGALSWVERRWLIGK